MHPSCPSPGGSVRGLKPVYDLHTRTRAVLRVHHHHPSHQCSAVSIAKKQLAQQMGRGMPLVQRSGVRSGGQRRAQHGSAHCGLLLRLAHPTKATFCGLFWAAGLAPLDSAQQQSDMASAAEARGRAPRASRVYRGLASAASAAAAVLTSSRCQCAACNKNGAKTAPYMYL